MSGSDVKVVVLISRPDQEAILLPVLRILTARGIEVQAGLEGGATSDNLAPLGIACHVGNDFLEPFILAPGNKMFLYAGVDAATTQLGHAVAELFAKYGIPSLDLAVESAAPEAIADRAVAAARPTVVPKVEVIRTNDGRPIFPELGYERYVRLMGLAEQIDAEMEGPYSLLDIGGEDSAFRAFVPGAEYTAYSEFITRERGTGFDDDSFDVVVAADVLEHVLVPDREAFLNELIRVAGRLVVFSFPCEAANPHEHFILELMPDHRWLMEHQENGLPDQGAVEILLDGLGASYRRVPNHQFNSWVYSVVFDHAGIDEPTRRKMNRFLQEQNFPREKQGDCYRQIYVVKV